VWDGAGLTNASPHNGQVFAAFSIHDTLYSLAILPCRHLACNRTFKRGGRVSPRAKRSSQESRTSLLSLLGAARATELDTVDQTRRRSTCGGSTPTWASGKPDVSPASDMCLAASPLLPRIERGNRAIFVAPLHFALPKPSRVSISCLSSPFQFAGMKSMVDSYQLKCHLVIDVARPWTPHSISPAVVRFLIWPVNL
jgi:hypothetical protein